MTEIFFDALVVLVIVDFLEDGALELLSFVASICGEAVVDNITSVSISVVVSVVSIFPMLASVFVVIVTVFSFILNNSHEEEEAFQAKPSAHEHFSLLQTWCFKTQ